MIKIQLNEQQTREFFGGIRTVDVPVNISTAKDVYEGCETYTFDGVLYDNYRAQFTGNVYYQVCSGNVCNVACDMDTSTAKFYLGQLEIEFVGVPQDTVETYINGLSHRLIPVVNTI